mgnify:CR=1 FL=1
MDMGDILCAWEPSTYLIFSSNVPSLVHYSHLIAMLAALTIGLLIYFNNPKGRVPRLLLLFVSFFSVWAFLDLVLWATNRPDVVMFSWSLQVLLEPLTYITAFYVFHAFLYRTWPSFRVNLFIAILLLPIISLLFSTLTLEALVLSSCEANEGPIAKYYTYVVHAIMLILILTMGVRQIPRLPTSRERSIALFFGLGLTLFLLAFSSGTVIGSLTDDWEPSQYGLFGMPLFAAFIAYGVIQFRAFNAKVLSAQILVIALGIAVISLVALENISNVRIIATLTFILVCVLGFILVKSVRREVEQREHIQKLADDLKEINTSQEALMHFIGHEVKGSLTKALGGFDAIASGGIGDAVPDIKQYATRAMGEMEKGGAMVTNILDAANLKEGKMEIKKEKFDFVGAVNEITTELRHMAAAKHLTLSVSVPPKPAMIVGDKEKLIRHTLRNLIENAIYYSPTGSIVVLTKIDDVSKQVVFSVTDTGIGISSEDMKKLFKPGGRGKDSTRVNAHSTGFGLSIAKGIVDAHAGTITASSQGAGRGSTFTVTLPLA